MSELNGMYLKEIDFMKASEEEMEVFTDNARMNISCAKAIQTAIAENYGKVRQWCLDVQAVMDSVLSEYEPSRMAYCLATVIDEQNYDGRYSRANKEWAKEIRDSLPEMYKDREKSSMVGSVVGKLSYAHQGLIDMVTSNFRKAFPEITCLEHKESESTVI